MRLLFSPTFSTAKGFVVALSLLLVTGHVTATVIMPEGVLEERLATEILWKGFKQLPAEKRPKIVLVLGGGGARGLAHIGVLRVFEEEGIPVDEIVGVSVGALIGALYSSGLSIDKIEQMAGEIGWSKLTNFSKVSLVRLILSEELLSTNRMEKYLSQHIGGKTFSDLNIPFACVATDIRNGERVVFREGPVAIAARASATIPAIFKPVEYRQRLLVDGGLVDNLPTGEVSSYSEYGNVVIGVLPKAELKSAELSNVFQSLVRSVEIQKEIIQKEKRKAADFMIEPDVGQKGLTDLNKNQEFVEAGTIATRERALSLKKLILDHTHSILSSSQ